MKKLSKGLMTDSLLVDQEVGSWSDARNVVVYKKRGAVSNEDGFDNVTPVTHSPTTYNYPTKPCIGSITLPFEKILFFGTTNPADSELGRITSAGDYVPILKDAILNFNQNFPIEGVFQNKFNDNIILAWTDRNDYLKILNIDCIPFGVDPITFAVVPADVEKAKVFLRQASPFDTPIISPYNIQVRDGAGVLIRGAYYPIAQYELLDGTLTSWSKVYNGVPIFGDNLNSNANSIAGDYDEVTTNKSIEITFNNIDINYRRLRIGYLFVSAGQTFAYSEEEYLINSSTLKVFIRGVNRTQLNLGEVLTPNAIYKNVKSITTLLGRLDIANLEEEEVDLQYQIYANLITVKYISNARTVFLNNVVAKAGIDGSGNIIANSEGTYQDGARVFFDKTFRGGEAYALYIRFKLTNGNYSKDYHIPGRVAVGNDRVVEVDGGAVDGLDFFDGGNPIYRYQVFDTASAPTATSMGYWENENEEYPEDPNNPGNVHPDYANIPGVSFGDRKVRHHVFPADFSNNLVYGDAVGAGSYPTYLNVRPLGLEISNVNVPASILDLVDSWEIFYAERNNSNVRMLSEDAIITERFHPFDLMTSKPNIFPTYIMARALYRTDLTAIPATEKYNFVEYLQQNGVAAGNYYALGKFQYVGENTTVPVNNTNKADSIYFETFSGATPATLAAANNIENINFKQYTMFDICIYRRDTYLSFQTQNLISTGIAFKITASGVQGTQSVYGGDCYFGRHSFVDATTPSPDIFSLPVRSVSNIGLRSEDVALSKFFYPKSTTPTPSWYQYNSDYNCVNRFNSQDIYYPSDGCTDVKITKHPFRVAQSLTEGSESALVNWRIFKINSYYDMPRNKGEIWKILGGDRTLYIHHELSLFIAEVKDRLNTQGTETYLGVSDIFDRPPQEVLSVSEGFAGTQSQYACILCKIGYCFIDRKAGKVFVYNKSGLKEISDQGMYNFFSDNSETFDKDTDNPFISKGYVMAYDNDFNRLIISKTEDGDISNPVNEYSTSSNFYRFCLSYCPDVDNGNGGWVSFHDYNPNVMFYNRSGLFSIDNYTFKLFRHNSATTKGIYYNGVKRDAYIDVVFNEAPEQTKRFDNVNWITTVELNRVNYKDETATHLVVFNENQCSGRISLKAAGGLWFEKDVKNNEGTWGFNNFRDLLDNPANPFLDNKNQIITSNINSNKAWFEMSKFISKFVVFRIITDNISQKNLHISLVDSNVKKSDR